MAERRKLPLQIREAEVCTLETRKEGNATRISFALSSEHPVERVFGVEVLSHDAGSVRMDRLTRRAMPLLFNHNADDPIGMVDSGGVRDGRLVVEATMFDTERAREVEAMLAGGLRNVSVGYRIHDAEEDRKSGQVRVTDWEPYEASIVTIPADPTVGLGRSGEQVFEVEIRSTETAQTAEETAMTDQVNATAGASAEPVINALQAERNRRAAIESLCKSNKIDSRVEARWIADGSRLEDDTDESGRVLRKGIASQILDVMEERGRQRPAVAAELGLSKNETQKYSLFRAIRALKFGGQNSKFLSDAGFEIECSQAVARKLGRDLTTSILVPAEVLTRPLSQEAMNRAMATQPGASGGFLVNVENLGFIDILRNRSVARAMGARVLSGLEGNVTFARQTGKPSVTWQGGEGVSVTAADQTLGQLSMTPKTAIVITDVSEQLLRQSNPSAEQFVMADLAANIAIDGVDAATINGAGGAQPIGIKNTVGVTTGQDASGVTYGKVLAFVTTAGTSNAIRGNPGFVTNIAGAAVLAQKSRFANTDTPLWQGNLLDGTVVGFRGMSSEQLASGNIIFGSWDELVIGEWGVLELATDTGGTRFNQAQVGIRAMWMVDVMLRYPQAFVVGTNLAA
jgi:HK97 family phage major capsid protein/HK97 family phage prohead protease